MFKHRSRRSGFTLPEVLVTVAIVAVLAAAVVPTVVNQLEKGSTGAVASDLNALTNAVTSFVADTRVYPGDLADLVAQPDGTTDFVLGGAAGSYPLRARNAWKGPYLATTQDLEDGFVLSGFNVTVDSLLVAPAAANGFHITLSFSPSAGTFTEASLLKLDQALDGGDGAALTSGTCVDLNNNAETGKLTWEMTGTAPTCTVTPGTIRFRLVPVGS